MKKVIFTDKAPAAIGPYSQAIEAGGTIYVSGQLPIDPATGDMPESVKDQAHQSLLNLKSIVEAAGCTLSNVVKTTIWLTDIADFATVNSVYAEYFTADFPARACYAVVALPKGAKVEIEAIAAK